MIEHIIILKPKYTKKGKIFLPDYVIKQMCWNTKTKLMIKQTKQGIVIHKIMIEDKTPIGMSIRHYYTAPFIYTPDRMNISATVPTQCSYLIDSGSYPIKLNIILPNHLKPAIKMTNVLSNTITI